MRGVRVSVCGCWCYSRVPCCSVKDCSMHLLWIIHIGHIKLTKLEAAEQQPWLPWVRFLIQLCLLPSRLEQGDTKHSLYDIIFYWKFWSRCLIGEERDVQKSYWMEHSAELTVEAMMLDSQASDLDKEERPEVRNAMLYRGLHWKFFL